MANKMQYIYLVSWRDDFMESVAHCIWKTTGGHPENAVVVFPNLRPGRYLKEIYKKQAQELRSPILMPSVLSIDGLFALCRREWDGESRRMLREPDRLALIYDAMRESLEKHSTRDGLFRIFGAEDTPCPVPGIAECFSWLRRLDSLLEECFSQKITPHGIPHTDGQVGVFAGSLLESLGEIYSVYKKKLDAGEQGLTTPGHCRLLAAEHADAAEKLPDQIAEKDIFLCGFANLTSTEQSLFRLLCRNGANVCLRGDPKLMSAFQEGKPEHHYSCDILKNLVTRFLTKIDGTDFGTPMLLEARHDDAASTGKESHGAPHIKFRTGYDLHSQLDLLLQDFRGEDANEESAQEKLPREQKERSSYSQAIILPDSGSLMPLLHEMSDEAPELNVSVGYPLKRSLLGLLITQMIELQKERISAGPDAYGAEASLADALYARRGLADLLRHPYVQGLTIPPEPEADSNGRLVFDCNIDVAGSHEPSDTAQEDIERESNKRWRQILWKLQAALSDGGRAAGIEEHIEKAFFGESIPLAPEEENAMEDFFRVFVYAWEEAETMEDLANCLENLVDFLRRRSPKPTKNRLDDEFLYRLEGSLIPLLKGTMLSDSKIGQENLFNILEELLDAERVPFDSDDLGSVQVLGMLESRLLRFDKVYVLDMTDKDLPGIPDDDPLLPDEIRTDVLNLPGRESRELTAALTFFSLINGAHTAYLYWPAGTPSSGVQGGRQAPSRFVEELLWNEQKKLNDLKFKPDSAEIVISQPEEVHSHSIDRKAENGSDPFEDRICSLFASGLSATALNCYLHCPARFFYDYVAGLNAEEQEEDEDDVKQLGVWLHKLMRSYYAHYVDVSGGHWAKTPESRQRLLELFDREINSGEASSFLSPESKLMAETAGRRLLDLYHENQPGKVRILYLEPVERPAANTCSVSVPVSLMAAFAPGESENRKGAVVFKGRFDRVDLRFDEENNRHIVIVDYKSGKYQKKRAPKLDDDPGLAKDLQTYVGNSNQDTGGDKLLARLAKAIPDLQLPFYLWLWEKSRIPAEGNHALCLSAEDAELPVAAEWIYLGGGMDHQEKNAANDSAGAQDWRGNGCRVLWDEKMSAMTDLALRFLVKHMLSEKSFASRESARCNSCPHSSYCRNGSKTRL